MEEKNTNNTCVKCQRNLDEKYFEFRKDTNKRRGYCRQCNKGYLELRENKVNKILDLFNQGLKECGKCKEILQLSNFHNDKNTITKLTSWCIYCKKKYQMEQKDAIKSSRLKKIYNITLDDYNKLLEQQNYTCAICKTNTPKGRNNRFHVDHNHETGKVRGLLCHFCNNGLGNFKDNKSFLNKAIEYLS